MKTRSRHAVLGAVAVVALGLLPTCVATVFRKVSAD